MRQTNVFISGKTDLSKYDNSWYSPNASLLKRGIWFVVNAFFFINPLIPISDLKVWLLRLFGATVGKGVIIKPSVNIKYPWMLHIGDYAWIGENVWIDNLTTVIIGKHSSISQGAMLLTGNHDFTTPQHELLVKSILLEDGVWIGAKAVVCPGVICHSHSILSVGSVATKSLEAYWIYQGNPAQKKRERFINKSV